VDDAAGFAMRSRDADCVEDEVWIQDIVREAYDYDDEGSEISTGGRAKAKSEGKLFLDAVSRWCARRVDEIMIPEAGEKGDGDGDDIEQHVLEEFWEVIGALTWKGDGESAGTNAGSAGVYVAGSDSDAG